MGNIPQENLKDKTVYWIAAYIVIITNALYEGYYKSIGFLAKFFGKLHASNPSPLVRKTVDILSENSASKMIDEFGEDPNWKASMNRKSQNDSVHKG